MCRKSREGMVVAMGQGQFLSCSTGGLGNGDVTKSPKIQCLFRREDSAGSRKDFKAMQALQGIISSSLATSTTAVLLHSKVKMIEFRQDCSPPLDLLQER